MTDAGTKTATPTSPPRITKSNTAWVFISASQEERHLHDIVYGIQCLKKQGVVDKDIFIFVDHLKATFHFGQFSITQNIFAHMNIATICGAKEKGYEHLFVFVTGHGTELGHLPFTGKTVNPEVLFLEVRKCTTVKSINIILGQCNAGVFNYVDAVKPPPLCIMGATNLHNSLSSPTKVDLINPANATTVIDGWGANIFLLNFFEWIAAPVDTDGDGVFTIVDAFKYAGTKCNERLLQEKQKLALNMDEWLVDHKIAARSLKQLLPPAQHSVFQDSINKIILRNLGILHMHQEPWILNVNFGRQLIFDFAVPVAATTGVVTAAASAPAGTPVTP